MDIDFRRVASARLPRDFLAEAEPRKADSHTSVSDAFSGRSEHEQITRALQPRRYNAPSGERFAVSRKEVKGIWLRRACNLRSSNSFV